MKLVPYNFKNNKNYCLDTAGLILQVWLNWPQRRKKDNIEVELKEIVKTDWIHVARDEVQWLELVNVILNVRVP
jgi:hypothetical protein